jgi:hypothetical protein
MKTTSIAKHPITAAPSRDGAYICDEGNWEDEIAEVESLLGEELPDGWFGDMRVKFISAAQLADLGLGRDGYRIIDLDA